MEITDIALQGKSFRDAYEGAVQLIRDIRAADIGSDTLRLKFKDGSLDLTDDWCFLPWHLYDRVTHAAKTGVVTNFAAIERSACEVAIELYRAKLSGSDLAEARQKAGSYRGHKCIEECLEMLGLGSFVDSPAIADSR